MSDSAPALVADQLVSARREGRSLTGFPGPVPAGMVEAYRIQDAAIASWSDDLVGWKIGYIAPDRRSPDEPDRLVGPIWRGRCHPSDGPPVDAGIFAAGFAAVEAEFVVRLGQDLPARDGAWTAAEVAELDQQLLVGIEVASSPIPDINALGPAVIAADFGNNNGLLLGPELADAAGIELVCSIDGEIVGRGPPRTCRGTAPRSGHRLQHHRRARSLRTRGRGLRHRRHHRHPPDPARSALPSRGPRPIVEGSGTVAGAADGRPGSAELIGSRPPRPGCCVVVGPAAGSGG